MSVQLNLSISKNFIPHKQNLTVYFKTEFRNCKVLKYNSEIVRFSWSALLTHFRPKIPTIYSNKLLLIAIQ